MTLFFATFAFFLLNNFDLGRIASVTDARGKERGQVDILVRP